MTVTETRTSDPVRAAAPCARCEVLPQNQPPGAGRLFLWPPLGHTAKKIRGALQGSAWSIGVAEGEALVAPLRQDELEEVCGRVAGVLTSTELRDTRALYKHGDADPSLRDLGRVDGFVRLLATSQSGWLVDMLAQDRLTALFQPIVYAEEPCRIFAQECLLRGLDADGALVPPMRLLDTAREVDVIFQLDLAARRTAIREASLHGIRSKIFINFTPTSIYDPVFCLRSTVAAIDDAGIAHEDVVFEVIETDRAHDPEHLKAILAYYRNEGFGVALDDMGAGYSSLNLIHQLRPDYIKLDMELTRGVHEDPYKALIAAKCWRSRPSWGYARSPRGWSTLGSTSGCASTARPTSRDTCLVSPPARPSSRLRRSTAPPTSTPSGTRRQAGSAVP